MWKQFENIDVECWEHAGKIGIAEPSLCLFHATVDRGRVILQALDELLAEGCDSQRAMTFRPSQRDRSIGTLRLRLVAPTNELRVMNISCGVQNSNSAARGQAPQNSELAGMCVDSTSGSFPPILSSAVPDPGQMLFRTLTCGPGTATIEMTPVGLQSVRHAVSVWCDGGEDFGVSPRHANLKKRELGIQDTTSGELWFWGPGYEGP